MRECRGTAGVLSATLAFCSLIGSGMSTVKVDVRCHCNLPQCVATGYMCRSSAGVCATEKADGRGRHGCLELLDADCKRNATQQCCYEDMCNSFEEESRPHTHLTGYLSNRDTSLLLRGGASSDPRPLFRIMVICVPLAGGAVLVILIVMAARMLRVERRRQTRLKPADSTPRNRLLLPKSRSCVLPVNGRPGCVVRSYASVGNVGAAGRGFYRSATSLSLSVDSGCTDSSKEKYFVFDV